MVAFLRDHNLYVVGTEGGPRAGCDDRRAMRGCYTANWIGFTRKSCTDVASTRAYWWSPDSKWIALLRLDESPVPDYTVADNIPYHPNLEVSGIPDRRRSSSSSGSGCRARCWRRR